jgi:hypothetical protein
MEFLEALAFTRLASTYLAEDELAGLQARLALDPEAGDLMPGTGGFRKLRVADVRRGKGRRGGLRLIYYYFPADHRFG